MLALIAVHLQQLCVLLGAVGPVPKSRRHLEAQNNFLLLRQRLDKENQLHALMLSQRHFRRGK